MKRCVLVILALSLVACGGPSPEETQVVCTAVPIMEDAAQAGVDDGAVVVYERIGGKECSDVVWFIYPDGRIVGENGHTKVEETISTEQVSALLAFIDEEGFFDLWSTEHTACRDCYTYYITAVSDPFRKGRIYLPIPEGSQPSGDFRVCPTALPPSSQQRFSLCAQHRCPQSSVLPLQIPQYR